MKVLVLCPQWGFTDLPFGEFLDRVEASGYDGVDIWMPDSRAEQDAFIAEIKSRGLVHVAHQWKAAGDTFEEFKSSFESQLQLLADTEPLLINSHTGKDFFSFEENCELLEIALDVAEARNIKICHETHRGRFAFAPGVTRPYLERYPELMLTADFSHWTNVSESFLEGFGPQLELAISRAHHVHARVGHTQSAQVPDPRVPEWQHAVEHFVGWWKRTVAAREADGAEVLSFTCEFGPAPYMVNDPGTGEPLVDQWELNEWVKGQLIQL